MVDTDVIKNNCPQESASEVLYLDFSTACIVLQLSSSITYKTVSKRRLKKKNLKPHRTLLTKQCTHFTKGYRYFWGKKMKCSYFIFCNLHPNLVLVMEALNLSGTNLNALTAFFFMKIHCIRNTNAF